MSLEAEAIAINGMAYILAAICLAAYLMTIREMVLYLLKTWRKER